MKDIISILISVKNESQYITEALDSISDKYIDDSISLEIIIVDDGSEDDTCKIIKNRNQSNILLIETEGVGKARAYSIAYENASGQYFILFAGDDILIPEVLLDRIRPLKNFIDEPAVVFSKLLSFSKNSKYHDILLPKNPLLGMRSGAGITFNRVFGEMVFPIPETLPNEDSWIIHFHEYFDVKIFEVPKVCMKYRIHENNSYKRGINFNSVREQQWIRARASLLFYSKYFSILDKKSERNLLYKIVINILKYYGNSIVLLCIKGVSFNQKLKALFNSNSIFYKIREMGYSFFSGR